MKSYGEAKFEGEVLSVDDLLAQSLAAPDYVPAWGPFLHTASGNAGSVTRLLSEGGSLAEGWRFGVLQTLDDYESTKRRAGIEVAAQVFSDEPAPTGYSELDAAFAALADYLAERDGWDVPQWAAAETRKTEDWFPGVPEVFREAALIESPRAFRDRGIFTTEAGLSRA